MIWPWRGVKPRYCSMREKASTRRTSNKTAGPESLEKESNWLINSLAPGRIECSSRSVIFKLIQVIGDWDISYEIALILMSLDLTDDKSTVVQVMAWCHQATSHYLSQCWPRSMSPHGVTGPQWVNCRLVTPYANIDLGQHWLRHWLVAWPRQAITWNNGD